MGKFNDALDGASKIGGTAGSIIGGVNAVAGLFQNKRKEERRQDQRQIDQQGKLQELQMKGSKEMGDYENELKMKMWKDTNYSAQIDQATKAGLSKVAVLGGGGGGTQGASVGGPTGGQAGSGQAGQMAGIAGEMAKAQIANLNANTEKTKVEAGKLGGVDTDNVTQDVRSKKFDTDLKEAMRNANIDIKGSEQLIKQVESDKANTKWGTEKSAGYNGMEIDPSSKAYKSIQAELDISAEKLKSAKINNDINTAIKEIKEFEAKMANAGIAPNSPWYLKTLTDLAGKAGISLNDLKE